MEGPRIVGSSDVRKALGKLNPAAAEYEGSLWVVRVFDTKHPQPSGLTALQADFMASAAQSACWAIRNLHWLPSPQQGGSPWIVCTRGPAGEKLTQPPTGPAKKSAQQLDHEAKHALYCQHVSGNERELMFDDVSPSFKIGTAASSLTEFHPRDQSSTSMAAYWGTNAQDVVLYALPSLHIHLTFQEAHCSLRHEYENAVQFSPDATKLAIWWWQSMGQDPEMMMLAIYDARSGLRLAAFSDQVDRHTPAPASTYLPCLIVWSTLCDRLLWSRKDSYYVHELLTGYGFPIWIEPRPSSNSKDASVECGWMPCGQVALVVGRQVCQQVSVSGQAQVSVLAVSMDGSIISSWICLSGWQTTPQLCGCSASLEDHPKLKSVMEFAWGTRRHPLEPIWSRGIAGLLQPHDHLTALISSQINSHLGLGFPTHDRCIYWDDWARPHCRRASAWQTCTPKLSPNGQLLVLAPCEPEPTWARQHMHALPEQAHGQRCSHLVWNAAQQQMEQHITSWPAWTCFAWHPAANFTSTYAVGLMDGRILVADARNSAAPVRSWSYAALRKLKWHPARAMQALRAGRGDRYPQIAIDGPCIWDCIAWSPDGTKLFAAVNDQPSQ